MEEFLRDRLSIVSSDQAAVDHLWERIRLSWSESHRHYHTLEHLENCVRVAGDVAPEMLLALYFHDMIYDPLRSDNEAASAKLVRNWLGNCGIEADAETIERLVLATDHRNPPVRDDEKLIVDIDLSILGSAPEDYDRYSENVRKEYGYVSESDWRAGRANILESFLQRTSIFSTDHLNRRFEVAARANLSREFTELKRA